MGWLHTYSQWDSVAGDENNLYHAFLNARYLSRGLFLLQLNGFLETNTRPRDV